MTHHHGVGIGHGIAYGPLVRMAEPAPAPTDEPSTRTIDAEHARVRDALSVVAQELASRGARVGGTAQDVLAAQAMIAQDPSLISEIDRRLQNGATGEFAVHDALAAFRTQLESLGGYLAERAADLDDVAQRVIAHLRGVAAPGVPTPGHPFVLLARDLAPADTALLDLEQVLALITTDGGPTSHTAILAREKAIVAVVGAVETGLLRDGDVVIVDALNDRVTSSPSDDELSDAVIRAAARTTSSQSLEPGRLADGTPVPLLANLGSPEAADQAVALGAEGVGLFRTEFLFLGNSTAPSIAQQKRSYTELLTAFPGRKVVVRVLDAGADKPLAFLNDAAEENPALGLRGLRALRANEQILRDQLTALAEAYAETDADLWVMAPMVATVSETVYFTDLVRAHGLKTAGVMIEVPSSALLADHVLASTDFASIGTNDLTQYTLAADRLLGSVAHLQDPWHPAVLRLIREVGDAGRRRGKPVGICGEAAADPLLAVAMVGFGATSLSMAPAALADVRAALVRYTLPQAHAIAEAAVLASDAPAARAAAQRTAADFAT